MKYKIGYIVIYNFGNGRKNQRIKRILLLRLMDNLLFVHFLC